MNAQRPSADYAALCLGALLALTGSALIAEESTSRVYECEKDGKVTYSGQPCGSSEERLEVDYNSPGGNAAAGAKAEEGQTGNTAEGELLDTEILNAQDRIEELEDERNARIAELREEAFAGTEGLDQKAWQAQMDARIQAVQTEYQDDIDTEQARLTELEAKRAELQSLQH
jgi:hypothetical protein